MSGEVDSFQTTVLSTRDRSNVPSLAENFCVTFTVSVLKVAGFIFLDVTDVRHWRCEECHRGQGLRRFTTNKQTGRQAGRQTDTQTDRQAGRQTDRQTDKQTDRQAGRQTGRQAEIQRLTETVQMRTETDTILCTIKELQA